MGHTWKNVSHVERYSHFENLSLLEKWVIFGKMGHSWKHGSHLEICVTLGKKPHLKKGHTSNRVTIEIHWSNFKKVVTR